MCVNRMCGNYLALGNSMAVKWLIVSCIQKVDSPY